MNPYPWNGIERFGDEVAISEAITGLPATIASSVATLLSPPAWLWRGYTRQGFQRYNDSWWRRGLIIITVGLILTALMRAPAHMWEAINDLLLSLGDKRKKGITPGDAAGRFLLFGFGPATTLHGLAALAHSYEYEYASQRFLGPVRPGWRIKARRRRNTARLATGHAPHNGWIPFGIIGDDHIPWRTPRIGMVVERPITSFGHGIVLGATGTGKTVFAENAAYYFLTAGGAVVYIDCKASKATHDAMRAVAAAAGVPFQAFDLGIGAGDATRYDPLAWRGTPAEKSAMLMSSFRFADSGNAVFYANAAEAWLPLQFEVLDAVGLAPGEGVFDFLAATATPTGLRGRGEPWRDDGDPAHAAAYQRWTQRTHGVQQDHLTGLRNNLERVINGTGDRLRPSTDPNTPTVSIRDTVAHRGVLYIGLSAATDKTTLETVGSLAIRDLATFSGERAPSSAGSGLRTTARFGRGNPQPAKRSWSPNRSTSRSLGPTRTRRSPPTAACRGYRRSTPPGTPRSLSSRRPASSWSVLTPSRTTRST